MHYTDHNLFSILDAFQLQILQWQQQQMRGSCSADAVLAIVRQVQQQYKCNVY